MNAADLIIIGVVVVLGLVGLKSGFLRPVSGIGGIVLGIFLAIQYSGDVAIQMGQYVEGDMVKTIAAFVIVVLAVAIAIRIAAVLIRKLLSMLALGWLDHVAGAVGGAALGIVLSGTAVYLLIGADFEPTADALASSKLAPEIVRISLVNSSTPWCSQVDSETHTGPCTNLKSLTDEVFGFNVADKVEVFLSDDLGAIAEVVQTSVSGTSQDLAKLASSDKVNALFDEGIAAITEKVQEVADGGSNQ